MALTTQKLIGGSVLVKGTDSEGIYGEQVLRSWRWAAVQHYRNHQEADEAFGEAVEKFFAPLTELAETIDTTLHPEDPWSRVVLVPATEQGRAEEAIDLDPDGILLRILEETDGSTLRWVNAVLVALAE